VVAFTKRIKVIAADSQPLFLTGISTAIEQAPDIWLVASSCTGKEAIKHVRAHGPDVTVISGDLPDIDAVELIEAILKHAPRTKIMVVTNQHGDAAARRALSAGARAYLLKEITAPTLIEAIRSVNLGGRTIEPSVATALASQSTERALTRREMDVLKLLAGGNSNVKIAARLATREDTVKGHIKKILKKLSARDRTHAVLIAVRRGIVPFS
jgi:two-component system NarL family response regulator